MVAGIARAVSDQGCAALEKTVLGSWLLTVRGTESNVRVRSQTKVWSFEKRVPVAANGKIMQKRLMGWVVVDDGDLG